MHPLIRTCKGPDILLKLAYVKKSRIYCCFNSIVALTKQPSAERYLANIFSPVFLWTFWEILWKFLQRIKICSENFQKVHKKTPLAKSYFRKVPSFYISSHRSISIKKGVLRKVFAKFTGKHLSQRLYFNKVAGQRL